MVPPPHPFERRKLDLLDRPPGPALADQLGLVEVVDRLGEGIVIRVPDSACRRGRAKFDDAVGVNHRHVVRAVVGVMDQPVERAVRAPGGHVQRL